MAAKSPEAIAASWRKRYVAHLAEKINVPVWYRIDTEAQDENTRSSIDVSLVESTEVHAPRSSDKRFSQRWVVQGHRGNSPLLRGIHYGIINIASTPPSESLTGKNGDIRPYGDALFLTGELGLTVVTSTEVARAGEVLNIGKVIGLTIIAHEQDYPVWAPSTGN